MAYEEIHKTILLVSDNQVDIRRIEKQFMDTGALECRLYRCSTIGAAGEQLGKKKFNIDVVILDTRLTNSGEPGDMYKELQISSQDIPVIILTGDSEEELSQAQLLAEGGAFGVTRRDNFDELIDLIRKTMYKL